MYNAFICLFCTSFSLCELMFFLKRISCVFAYGLNKKTEQILMQTGATYRNCKFFLFSTIKNVLNSI